MTLLLALAAPALAWPSSTDWIPLESGGSVVTDPCGDVSGNDWWDAVGDASNPVVYTYSDGTYLWFRMRLADEPYANSGNGWRSFGWGVMFETDFDATDEHYDYILYV